MAARHFFKRHQGRGSYNLFASYNYFLPGIKGMIMLLVMFLLGSLLGNLVVIGLTFGFSAEFAQSYGTVISYPLMFVPAMIYASYQSRKTEIWGELEGIPEGGIPLDSNNFGQLGGFKLALIVSFATLAAAFVAEPLNLLLPEMPEILKKALEQLTEGPLWVTLLSVSIFAPLFEEWLCRGLVLRGLLQKLNPFSAIAVSAAFFAILHMNPWQAIPAFLLGLLFGYVYYKTGSLKLTMLMHCVNNTFAALTTRIPSLEEAETFMDVLSPWAYICVFVACVLIICSILVILRGINRQA
ncbi:MAG: CPBP family intramembrane metalloprotease [Bacteroidales bacterium]|nr:CPBP family intramembrane metalloprotease [Bacteroidales bacterium]